MFVLKTLAAASAALALPLAASGQVASQTVDFDDNTVESVFSFASGNTATSGSITAPGNPGNGASVVIDALPTDGDGNVTQPTFAGGGFGGFDLVALLGVEAGNFTAADFDGVNVTFDIATSAGGGANSLRFDAGGTESFTEAVTLAMEFETDGAFVSSSFTLSETPGFAAFLRRLNDTDDTDGTNAGAGGLLTFQTSVSAGSDGAFAAGDTVFLDNIVLNNPNAIPEPASLALLGLGATALLGRRRKA